MFSTQSKRKPKSILKNTSATTSESLDPIAVEEHDNSSSMQLKSSCDASSSSSESPSDNENEMESSSSSSSSSSSLISSSNNGVKNRVIYRGRYYPELPKVNITKISKIRFTEKFSGNRAKLEDHLILLGMFFQKDNDFIFAFVQSLTGEALTWWLRHPYSYFGQQGKEKLLEAARLAYRNVNEFSEAIREFKSARYMLGTNFQVFKSKFEYFRQLLAWTDLAAIAALADAVPKELKLFWLYQNFTDYTVAVNALEDVIDNQRETYRTPNIHPKSPPNISDSRHYNNAKKRCSVHPASKHSNDECNAQRKETKHSGTTPPNTTPTTKTEQRRCFICKSLDHIATTCPQRRNDTIHRLEHEDASNPFEIYLEINGIPIIGLIDSGASKSVIPESLINQCNLVCTPHNEVIVANNNRVATMESQLVTVKHDNLEFSHKFLVIEGNQTVLIGRDLFAKLKIIFTQMKIVQPQPVSEPENHDEIASATECEVPVPEQQIILDGIQNKINENSLVSGLCTLPNSEFKLPLTDETPHYRRQYPIPLRFQHFVDDQITKWIDKGILIPATPGSGWNNPITLAPKKDANGMVDPNLRRTCLDPDVINKRTLPKKYPTPTIQEIISRMANKKVFSSVDARDAYVSCGLYEPDQCKTTITHRGRQLMFSRTIWGLKNAGAHFQHLMMELFSDFDFVSAFIDDIIIYSDSVDEHIHHVNAVIERLSTANIRLALDKCKFGYSAIIVLGHFINQYGHGLDKRKLAKLELIPEPTTGKEIMSLLGFANYFRNYFPLYAKTMAPLEKLRNVKKFTLNSQERAAVHLIKQVLNQAPMLEFANLDEPFRVFTDASTTGLGAILIQNINGKDHYIAMAARACSKGEANYSATQLELAAIVFALKQFSPYLLGVHFSLYTDHKALVFMNSCKEKSRLIGRYNDVISLYTFDIHHLPGIANILPDALSRLYTGSTDHIQDIDHLDTDHESKTDTTEAILNLSANNQPNSLIPETPLTHAEPNLDTEESDTLNRPVLRNAPSHEEIINRIHLLGHFGIAATTEQLKREGYDWPGMSKDIKRILGQCMPCNRFKITKKGFHPTQTQMVTNPMDHLVVDHLTLPTSDSGFNYVMVTYCPCSTFTILEAAVTKSAKETGLLLTQTCLNYGFPKTLQSDNGCEYVNQVIIEIKTTIGFDHRVTTPYNPKANGSAERTVGKTLSVLRKMLDGYQQSWPRYLKAVQYALNYKFNPLIGTTPFVAMFGRPTNPFKDYRELNIPARMDNPLARLEHLANIVHPALSDRANWSRGINAQHLDSRHRIIDIPIGASVMTIDPIRSGKLSPTYEGPFKVIAKKRFAYTLLDTDNKLLSRRFAPSQLKVIETPNNESVDSIVLEVGNILNHREDETAPGKYEYLTTWKDRTIDHEWIKSEDFHDIQPITTYWNELTKPTSKQKVKFVTPSTQLPSLKRKAGRPRKDANKSVNPAPSSYKLNHTQTTSIPEMITTSTDPIHL